MYHGRVMESGALEAIFRRAAPSLPQGAAARRAALRHEAGRAARAAARDRATTPAPARSRRQPCARPAPMRRRPAARGAQPVARPSRLAQGRRLFGSAPASRCTRRRRRQLHDPPRRVPRPGRRERLRQDDASARSSCARSSPTAGSVLFNDRGTARRRARARAATTLIAFRRKVQYIFQDPVRLAQSAHDGVRHPHASRSSSTASATRTTAAKWSRS